MPYDTSPLSQENILRDVHDPVTQTLRTSASATLPGGSIDVVIDAANDSIKIGDGSGNYVAVATDGSTKSIDLSSIVPFKFDDVVVTNSVIATKTVPTTCVYKSAGTTVATVTITYDGSANLTRIQRT